MQRCGTAQVSSGTGFAGPHVLSRSTGSAFRGSGRGGPHEPQQRMRCGPLQAASVPVGQQSTSADEDVDADENYLIAKLKGVEDLPWLQLAPSCPADRLADWMHVPRIVPGTLTCGQAHCGGIHILLPHAAADRHAGVAERQQAAQVAVAHHRRAHAGRAGHLVFSLHARGGMRSFVNIPEIHAPFLVSYCSTAGAIRFR